MWQSLIKLCKSWVLHHILTKFELYIYNLTLLVKKKKKKKTLLIYSQTPQESHGIEIHKDR